MYIHILKCGYWLGCPVLSYSCLCPIWNSTPNLPSGNGVNNSLGKQRGGGETIFLPLQLYERTFSGLQPQKEYRIYYLEAGNFPSAHHNSVNFKMDMFWKVSHMLLFDIR